MNNVTKQLINIRLLLTRNGIKRGKYLKKKKIFKEFGDNVWWQPYKIPTQPKLVKIGNNVRIATEVLFLEHDVIGGMLNNKYKTHQYRDYQGTIEIGNNCFIGGRVTLLYDIKIGNNCIVGAGSVINKDVPDNSVVVGNPAKIVGKTEDFEKKYKEKTMKMSKVDYNNEQELEKFFWNDGKV